MNKQNKTALEITQLHKFFQDWFNGELTQSGEEFDRCANVLASDFQLVNPNGQIIQRDALLDSLKQAHNTKTDMSIWIKNIQVHQSIGDVILATYQEWQNIDSKVTARQSSALFLRSSSAPNGILWLHNHETWIST